MGNEKNSIKEMTTLWYNDFYIYDRYEEKSLHRQEAGKS